MPPPKNISRKPDLTLAYGKYTNRDTNSRAYISDLADMRGNRPKPARITHQLAAKPSPATSDCSLLPLHQIAGERECNAVPPNFIYAKLKSCRVNTSYFHRGERDDNRSRTLASVAYRLGLRWHALAQSGHRSRDGHYPVRAADTSAAGAISSNLKAAAWPNARRRRAVLHRFWQFRRTG